MKKTLANRRMFRQGGAVNSGPTGILASSPSLIDAVAQDAMNVQGGPTVRMADGGIVRMANGGVASRGFAGPDYARMPVDSLTPNIMPGTGDDFVLKLGINPNFANRKGIPVLENLIDSRRALKLPANVMAAVGSRDVGDDDTVSERYMRLFPESLEPGGADQALTQAGQPVSRMDEFLYGVKSGAAQSARNFGQSINALTDVLTRKAPAGQERSDFTSDLLQTRAVMEMKERRPDLASEIDNLAADILKKNPEIDADALKNTVAYGLEKELIDKAARLMERDPTTMDEGDTEDSPAVDAMRIDPEKAENVYGRDLGQDDTLGEEDESDPTTIEDEPDPTTIADEPDPTGKAQRSKAQGRRFPLPPRKPNTVMGPGDQELDPNAGKYKMAGEEAVNQIKEAAKSGNEEETKNKLEDYINEFKSAIPEYEGKSEAEKGFDLVKMGMAVAAGESPEAITNISKGVLATIDNFTEDEKAKRAYKQQIALSAAKYGLQNLRRDREQLAADAKENRALFKDVFRVKTGETFTKADGTVAKEGDTVILTVGDIRGGKVDTSKLITEKNLIQQIKTKNSVAAANLDILKNKTTKPNKFGPTSKQYIEDGMRLRTNVATQSLLNRALVELQKPGGEGPLGIKATAKNMLLSLANSVNEKEFTESVFGPLDSQNKFDDFTNRAVTIQIEGLINEGGKITDQERKLAKEIGGALSKGAFSGVFEDRVRLERQIKEFSQALQRDSEARSRQMGLAERAWGDHYTTIDQVGKGPSYGQMLRAARPKLRGDSSPMASRILPGSINWTDIVSTDDKGTVTGFKRDWNSKK